MTEFTTILRDSASFKILILNETAQTLRDSFNEPDIFVNEADLQIESPTRGVTMWFTKMTPDIDGNTELWHAVNEADGVEIVSKSSYESFSDASILF